MKSLEDLVIIDNRMNGVMQSVEEELEKAEKDYEQGRVYLEEDVWAMFSKKYGFEL